MSSRSAPVETESDREETEQSSKEDVDEDDVEDIPMVDDEKPSDAIIR